MPFKITSGAKISRHLTGQHEYATARPFSFLETYGQRIALAAAFGAVLAVYMQ